MNHKTIVVIPGKADDLFFQMELPFVKKYFDRVVIISYPMSQRKAEQINAEPGIEVHVLPRLGHLIKNLIWLGQDHVKEELRSLTGGLRRLKKIAYLLLYGQTYLAAKQVIDEELANGQEVVLYSYWLSRGAYTIARIKHDYPDQVKLAVSRAHGYDLYLYRNPLAYLPFRSYIDRWLDEIWFISYHGRAYFNELIPPRHDSADRYVIHLGTRNEIPFCPDKSINQMPVIVSCSKIDRNKRLDLIIDVLSQLNRPFHWVHFGDGPLETKMKRYAEECLPEHSYEFAGHIDNEQILDEYLKRKVDFFINLSDSEGTPVTIMEASSLGIPAIARNVGGVSDIVNSGTGLLINRRIPVEAQLMYQDINQFIDEMVQDDQAYQAKRKASRKLWEDSFQANRNFDVFFKRLAERLNN